MGGKDEYPTGGDKSPGHFSNVIFETSASAPAAHTPQLGCFHSVSNSHNKQSRDALKEK